MRLPTPPAAAPSAEECGTAESSMGASDGGDSAARSAALVSPRPTSPRAASAASRAIRSSVYAPAIRYLCWR